MEAQFGFASEMVEGIARVSVVITLNCSEEFSSLFICILESQSSMLEARIKFLKVFLK